jgi:hypothetical protein
MNKSRDEFEAWLQGSDYADELETCYSGDINLMWLAWQAARASLKVCLPMWEYLPNGNQAYHATEVKGALKDIGVSYE